MYVCLNCDHVFEDKMVSTIDPVCIECSSPDIIKKLNPRDDSEQFIMDYMEDISYEPSFIHKYSF